MTACLLPVGFNPALSGASIRSLTPWDERGTAVDGALGYTDGGLVYVYLEAAGDWIMSPLANYTIVPLGDPLGTSVDPGGWTKVGTGFSTAGGVLTIGDSGNPADISYLEMDVTGFHAVLVQGYVQVPASGIGGIVATGEIGGFGVGMAVDAGGDAFFTDLTGTPTGAAVDEINLALERWLTLLYVPPEDAAYVNSEQNALARCMATLSTGTVSVENRFRIGDQSAASFHVTEVRELQVYGISII